jgi:Ni,Fe-hydrogenase III component G
MTARKDSAIDPPHYESGAIKEQIVPALQTAFPDDILDVQTMPVDETVTVVRVEGVRQIIRHLVEELDVLHLSTITGQEIEEGIELLYHFWRGSGLTLRVVLPLDALEVATVTDIIPGAAFYEREIVEMLGVTFAGHQDPLRLFLPDDWDGPPPLRKERS